MAVTTSGKNGVELAEKEPFDLLIADLTVTKEKGFSLIRTLRKTDNNIAVIAMFGKR